MEEAKSSAPEKPDILQIAEEAFEDSTTYVDQNYRREWEDAIRSFQNRHPQDSKYHKDSYKYRSRLYRPKTRSTIRRNEAAAAAAYFSSQDVISIEPEDDNEPIQQASAEFYKYIMNYRLTKTIPWFKTCIGALQDAQTTGIVCSYQHWKYDERDVEVPILDDDGKPVLDENGEPIVQQGKEVILDEPDIQIFPIENLRISPASSWVDPVGTSPYLIRMIPMFVYEIKDKMAKGEWKQLTDGEIMSARTNQYDSTRQERQNQKQDPIDDVAVSHKHFDVIWVHENFIRQPGEEVVFYSLGTDYMLTDPELIEDAYLHGQRPIVLGNALIETHRPLPSGMAELGKGLQKEANEIVNQRMDNVRLVLNKQYHVKRNSQVDTRMLTRNVAGGVVMMDNPMPGENVYVHSTPDVTSSAYAEQDRINLDYDELLGSFSPGTIQSNRQLNETVGGIGMLRGESGTMTGYLLRTFNETWVEPVLKQILMLEKHYESDEKILFLAKKNAEMVMKFGMTEQIDSLLKQEMTLTINMPIDAVDPQARLNRFVFATSAFAKIATENPGMDLQEVAKEIFGFAGYKDGRRFFDGENQDPRVMQLMDMVKKLQQVIDQKVIEKRAEMQANDREMAVDARMTQMQENNKLTMANQSDETKKLIADMNNSTKVLIADMNNKSDERMAIFTERVAGAKEMRDRKLGTG